MGKYGHRTVNESIYYVRKEKNLQRRVNLTKQASSKQRNDFSKKCPLKSLIDFIYFKL